MKSTLDCRDGHLCILNESELTASSPGGPGSIREWYAVREATESEVATLVGRPVTPIESEEGLYVDEDGNPYQLEQMGRGKPLAMKITPLGRGADASGSRSAEAESDPTSAAGAAVPDFSVNQRSMDSSRVRPKALLRKPRKKRQTAPREGSNGLRGSVELLAERPAQSADEQAPREKQPEENPQSRSAPLNLRQKLAEVRRRIGYVQKRGHNERFNYSYVTAADIAGSVGDLLAELGVVVIPKLEEISYESAVGRGEAIRMARVVMAYTFADVDSGEEIIAKVAGQGLDPGDKAPYKAMTGALKYALLQSFLLATGDDPEDDRGDGRYTTPDSDRLINAEEVRDLEKRIEDTGTDLERVLAYYKVASLGELTETAYRRAVEVLNRKLAKCGNQETVHAQD
jgi:ERF superfamily